MTSPEVDPKATDNQSLEQEPNQSLDRAPAQWSEALHHSTGLGVSRPGAKVDPTSTNNQSLDQEPNQSLDRYPAQSSEALHHSMQGGLGVSRDGAPHVEEGLKNASKDRGLFSERIADAPQSREKSGERAEVETRASLMASESRNAANYADLSQGLLLDNKLEVGMNGAEADAKYLRTHHAVSMIKTMINEIEGKVVFSDTGQLANEQFDKIVREFQTKHNLKKVDGIVGDETFTALKAEYEKKLAISEAPTPKKEIEPIKTEPKEGFNVTNATDAEIAERLNQLAYLHTSRAEKAEIVSILDRVSQLGRYAEVEQALKKLDVAPLEADLAEAVYQADKLRIKENISARQERDSIAQIVEHDVSDFWKSDAQDELLQHGRALVRAQGDYQMSLADRLHQAVGTGTSGSGTRAQGSINSLLARKKSIIAGVLTEAATAGIDFSVLEKSYADLDDTRHPKAFASLQQGLSNLGIAGKEIEIMMASNNPISNKKPEEA